MQNSFNKLLKLYPKSKKFVFFKILSLNLVNSLLEVFNIALVIPLFTVILNKTYKLKELEIIPEIFFQLSQFEQIILVIITILTVYVIKVFFYILGHYYLSYNVYRIGADLGNDLVTKYMLAPLNFHIEKSSSFMIRNVYKEINEFIDNNIRPSFHLINDLLILSGILIFLLIIDFQKFIFLIVFSFSIFLIFFSIKKFFINYGAKRQFYDERRLSNFQNILKSIKEIKIYNREDYFYKKFTYDNNQNYYFAGKNLFLNNMPRIIIEAIVLLLIISFLVYIIVSNSDLQNLDLEISMLFLAAIIRFVPIISRINSGINSLRFGHATLNLIYEELKDFNILNNQRDKTQSKFIFQSSIIFNNVNYKFENKSKNLFLNDQSFKINKGDLVKIVGKSGSGKTTLTNLLIGFLDPTKGEVIIDDKKLEGIKKEWLTNIGLVSQNIYLLNDTIEKNIVFGNINVNENKLNEVLKSVNLDNKENFNLKNMISENGKNLSGGEVQRIAIARALYNDSQFIIFDEPTSNLDNENSRIIETLINSLRKKKTILVISHDVELFKNAELTINL